MTPERYREVQDLVKKALAELCAVVLSDGTEAVIWFEAGGKLCVEVEGQRFLVVLSPRV